MRIQAFLLYSIFKIYARKWGSFKTVYNTLKIYELTDYLYENITGICKKLRIKKD
jgi:hypothetical protein